MSNKERIYQICTKVASFGGRETLEDGSIPINTARAYVAEYRRDHLGPDGVGLAVRSDRRGGWFIVQAGARSVSTRSRVWAQLDAWEDGEYSCLIDHDEMNANTCKNAIYGWGGARGQKVSARSVFRDGGEFWEVTRSEPYGAIPFRMVELARAVSISPEELEEFGRLGSALMVAMRGKVRK